MGRGQTIMLWLMIAVALGAAGVTFVMRECALGDSAQIELALDYDHTARYVRQQGMDLDTFLSGMREAGITTAVVGEMTLRELAEEGRVALIDGRSYRDIARMFPAGSVPALHSGNLVVLVPEQELWVELLPALRTRLGLERVTPLADQAILIARQPDEREEEEAEILRRTPWTDGELLDLGLGLDRKSLRIAQAHGLAVLAYVADYPGAGPEAVTDLANRLQGVASVSGVMFSGDSVLGGPAIRAELAQLLTDRGWYLAFMEHKEQRGLDELANAVSYRAVKLHHAYRGEPLDYVRAAVRERHVRMLYFRPIVSGAGGRDLLTYNQEYVTRIVNALTTWGYRTGQAEPLPPFTVPKWAQTLLIGGVAGAWILLWNRWWQKDWHPVMFMVVLAGVYLGGYALLSSPLANQMRELAAWCAAVGFPVLGLSGLVARQKLLGRQFGFWAPGLARAMGDLLLVSLVTVSGGLLLNALLGDSRYVLQLDQFRGVKLALALPPVVMAGLFFLQTDISPAGGQAVARSPWQRLSRFGKDLWSLPLTYGLVVGAAAALLIAAVILLRAGNFPLIPIPDLEVAMRDLLSQILVVRPRTKEFLFGHPALLLAAYLGLFYRGRYQVIFLGLAAIGQASVANTFSHIHTPLVFSLWRTFNGLWLGAALGMAAVGVMIGLYYCGRNWRASLAGHICDDGGGGRE
jgi:hypothetical protein